MGLLLGDITERPNGENIARIWIAMPQIRSDRRKDRVEASPEQLSRCAAAAEQFTQQGGVRTRVIGWYHSHPHITVLPSHVDIKTQATYQMLDDGFVGLIFSTFNQDPKNKSQSISVTAFQSVAANEGLSPAPSFTAGRLPSLDAEMAQAIQLSLAEARNHASTDSVRWQRKGVPLHIVQSQGPMERTLTDIVALAKVLYQEEQKAFHAAMAESADSDGNINPLAAIQHATMYQQNLCRLMELVLAPMLRSMQTCISQQQLQKQFGHRGNSMYHLQLPSQGSAAQSVAQPMAQLSTSMAQLLVVPGGVMDGLAAQASGVSSVGSQSWDPSASLHLHQSLLQHQQQQLPLQSQAQQPPSEAQTQPSYQMQQQQPQVQSVAEHQMPQSLSQPSFSLPYQSQLQHPPAQLISDQQNLTAGPSGYQPEQPQASAAQKVHVSIISPAIWTPADRPRPQLDTSASFGAPTQTAQMAHASAPAASHIDLAAAYGSSTFSSSIRLPSQQQQQQLQQQSPQQLSEKPLELRPRPPLGSNDSRRSIATNTQLTMHRGDSDAQSSGAARAPIGTSPAALSPSANSGWGQAQAQGPGLYQGAQGSAGPSVAGQAFLHSQPVLRSSDSTGSLTVPVEALEGRSSGQMPMRAGSPALGARASSKPPSWSSHMHDPFGDLVTQDLKRIGSSSSIT